MSFSEVLFQRRGLGVSSLASMIHASQVASVLGPREWIGFGTTWIVAFFVPSLPPPPHIATTRVESRYPTHKSASYFILDIISLVPQSMLSFSFL